MLSIKVDSNWKTSTNCFVKVGGNWREAKEVYYKRDGEWHKVAGWEKTPAWDETVVVTPAWDETITVNKARYTVTIYRDFFGSPGSYVLGTYDSYGVALGRGAEEQRNLEKYAPMFTNVSFTIDTDFYKETETIHHEAVTKTVHHEAGRRWVNY